VASRGFFVSQLPPESARTELGIGSKSAQGGKQNPPWGSKNPITLSFKSPRPESKKKGGGGQRKGTNRPNRTREETVEQKKEKPKFPWARE